MNGQDMHADGTLLPRGQFPERTNIQLRPDVELAASLIKHLLDKPALFLMLLAVLVQTILVAIPNAPAPSAHLEGTTFLSARRTHFGWGIFGGGLGFGILSFRRFSERHGSELLSSRRCTALFR